MIDERYERMRVRRCQIERLVIRIFTVVLGLIAIASIVAALMPGSETYDGTQLIEQTCAGSGVYAVVAGLLVLMLVLVWRWPRPRSVAVSAVVFWVALVIGFVATFSAPHRPYEDPPTYSHVDHPVAQHIADDLMAIVLVAWLALPAAAFVYGLVCVALDDRVRRRLPPAPEFPVARVIVAPSV